MVRYTTYFHVVVIFLIWVVQKMNLGHKPRGMPILTYTCATVGRMTGSEITMKREDEKIAWGFRLTGGADLGTPFYVVKVSTISKAFILFLKTN